MSISKKDCNLFQQPERNAESPYRKVLELQKIIKDKKPSSVYELAKMVSRDIKNDPGRPNITSKSLGL